MWEKANPLLSDIVVMAARNLGLIPDDMRDRNMILQILVNNWIREGHHIKDFPDLEAALLRLGKNYCRRELCDKCPIGECEH